MEGNGRLLGLSDWSRGHFAANLEHLNHAKKTSNLNDVNGFLLSIWDRSRFPDSYQCTSTFRIKCTGMQPGNVNDPKYREGNYSHNLSLKILI